MNYIDLTRYRSSILEPAGRNVVMRARIFPRNESVIERRLDDSLVRADINSAAP